MENDLRAYMDVLRRRAPWILRVFLVVVGIALVATIFTPPTYRASGLLEIRGGGGESLTSIEGMFTANDPSEEHLRTHFGLLRSATLARSVIQDLRLDTLDEFTSPGLKTRLLSAVTWFRDLGSDEETVVQEGPPQGVVNRFLDRLLVDPVAESRLVQIRFDAGDPQLAADIVNSILENYVGMSVGQRSDAAARLAVQVDSAQAQLAESEAELLRYADANGLPYIIEEDMATQVQDRLRDLHTQLAEARSQRFARESVYNMVVRGGNPDLAGDPVMGDLTVRLSELKREYARLSATFTDEYPEVAQLKRQIAEIESVMGGERQRIRNRVETEYQVAVRQENLLVEAIAEEERAQSVLGPKSGAYHVLRQAVLSNRALHAALQERQREAEVAAAMGPTDVAVVDQAVPPLDAHRPVFGMNIALAMMLGLVLGVGTALIREYADDTVQTGEDVNDSADLPVLALIPSLKAPKSARNARGLRNGARGRIRAADWPVIETNGGGRRPGRALADAFGALRTAVLFSRPRGDATPRSILISSCRVGEGKTTVSVNLALSLVGLGNRVLLVDADLRRPSVHRVLGVPSSPGLADHLRTGLSWQEMVRPTEVEGLHVLPSGGATHEAGNLLAGARTDAFLRAAEKRFDFVIVDAPALFISAYDARILATMVDGLVVVVRSKETPRALVNRIPEEIPNVIGVVINDLDSGTLPDYFRDYFEAYEENGGTGKARRRDMSGVAP